MAEYALCRPNLTPFRLYGNVFFNFSLYCSDRLLFCVCVEVNM